MTLNHRVPTGVVSLDENIQGGLPGGSMTLVAGNPGTGKTLLSGEFLHHGAKLGENGLYVSFSEGRESFLEYMRRVGKDMTSPPASDHVDILDLLTVKEAGIDNLMEIILERIEEGGAERLVLDSFSALANAYPEAIDARVSLHILSKLVRNIGCTTLLVAEIPSGRETIGLGLEEFIVDGIITLRRRTRDGDMLRELEITKMRGTEIGQPTQLFTLHGGFNVLPPFTEKPITNPARFRRIPDQPERLSTGHEQLDSILGGFRRGDTILMELGEDIPSLILGLLVGTMRANFIIGGSGVLMIPPGGESVERITRLDERFGLTEEERGSLLRIALMRPEERPPPYVINIDPDDIKKSIRTWDDEKTRLLATTGKPILKIAYIDKAYSLWPMEHTKRALDVESMVTKSEGGLLVLLVRPGSEDLARHSSNISGAHLSLTNEQGVILFRGIRPRTQLYALEMNGDGGYPRLRFTPMR